jgi:hypothetical protein
MLILALFVVVIIALIPVRKADPAQDWTIVRMRAATQGPIGPRYPSGLFTKYTEVVSE